MKNYEKTMRFFECLKKQELSYSELDLSSLNIISAEDYNCTVHHAYGKDIKNKIRALCLLAKLHEVAIKDVAYMLGKSESTVRRHITTFKKKVYKDCLP